MTLPTRPRPHPLLPLALLAWPLSAHASDMTALVFFFTFPVCLVLVGVALLMGLLLRPGHAPLLSLPIGLLAAIHLFLLPDMVHAHERRLWALQAALSAGSLLSVLILQRRAAKLTAPALAALIGGALLPAPATAAEPTVADLAWIAGCWAAEGGEPGSGEQWTAPAGGSMLGTARTVKGGQTVGFEFLRLAAGEGGRLTLFAQPSGQAPAAFPLLELGVQHVVFEDLAHDFPQRVRYERVGADRLLARIEGASAGAAGGAVRGLDFPMVRVGCPSGRGGRLRAAGRAPRR